MYSIKDHCRVAKRGVSHLFLGIDYGSICVCGRKTFAFQNDDEGPGLHDVPQEEPLAVAFRVAVARHKADPQLWKASLLLALGEEVIRQARRAREGSRTVRGDAAQLRKSLNTPAREPLDFVLPEPEAPLVKV